MAGKSTARTPQVFEAGKVTRLTPVRQRKPELNTLRGVRREMAYIYRQAESGQRDSAEASRLVYMLASIGKQLELTEIEERLLKLEGRADD
jgi:hypothetical protein